MDDQQNLLDYETIKSVVAGEKWQQNISLNIMIPI